MTINFLETHEEVMGSNSEDENLDVLYPGRLGPALKPWCELKPQMKRRLTQNAFEEVKKVAEKRDVEPQQVVGGLLRRYEGWQDDRNC